MSTPICLAVFASGLTNPEPRAGFVGSLGHGTTFNRVRARSRRSGAGRYDSHLIASAAWTGCVGVAATATAPTAAPEVRKLRRFIEALARSSTSFSGPVSLADFDNWVSSL